MEVKTLVTYFLVLFCHFTASTQVAVPQFSDSLFSTYYHQRVSHFKSLPQTQSDIIFLGNSITDGGEWSEMFQDLHVKNRGISGDNTAGVLHRLSEVYNRKPDKVFLLIGTNDLAKGISPDSVIKNIRWITTILKEKSPNTKIFVQSILPVNESFNKFGGHTSKKQQILSVNKILSTISASIPFTFLDIHAALADSTGRLDVRFTNDGLHLNGAGYQKWKSLIEHKMYLLPSLLPFPKQLAWTRQLFLLKTCKTIYYNHSSLKREAVFLQKQLAKNGFKVNITSKKDPKNTCIELLLSKSPANHLPVEAYQLRVNTEKVSLSANTAHGIFNGIQTLAQLQVGNVIQGCEISDSPAFSWRGYMVDVGRNYQSMPQLLQQIETMARYKLNVFHFHSTEDIAWRLAVKKYPQLTAPKTMQRQQGKYYSSAEIKQLIAFCEERHIEFVPEIDMPGHSQAFERAMGVTMQSAEGLRIVKEIIKEFCETYRVKYLHIGGDEVKITNSNFLPEVIKYAESFGKKVIGWSPGGNLSDQTIRQLWMGHEPILKDYQYIDTRHLYINHLDPLEAVTTIFHRKIGDKDSSDTHSLGATLCLWHDRNIQKEQDLLIMNAVYPSLLAFAERTWLGGGETNWITNVSASDSKKAAIFQAFEERLMAERYRFFSKKPFPYHPQAHIRWQMFGPFNNKGNLEANFSPEHPKFLETNPLTNLEALGGTIVLRHWWSPTVKGVLPNPLENTTWYAIQQVWSDTDTTAFLWLGFNNISRSMATNVPNSQQWDERFSKIWLNDDLLEAPDWKNGNQKPNLELPLIDEGYEYRKPLLIKLKKGWNEIKVKAPVGSFKGKDWQNPVKWMFTALPFFE
ncbi:family 20 glycosylhydrolase [Arcicella lustrica]|uniref:beta-N-acetylhexosaminidase n=1 Tax=Arcicella lustrica TaxID=2984196 RepID=A0ABU5SKE5_9BACT|nr:family 20 glycosylhydrolase [Arcicella sp. DC25W]MEA5427716.1 family 20 glycosylhydrolase [Arcicella sp. DC25W]